MVATVPLGIASAFAFVGVCFPFRYLD